MNYFAKNGFEWQLLKCLGNEEALKALVEIHKGMHGAHQGDAKMKWILIYYNYYQPNMIKDYIDYAIKCKEY